MGRRRTETGVDVADEALTLVAKVAVLLAIVLVAGSAVAYGYERAAAEQFYPSTRIGGVLIGSRTAAEAEVLLQERFVAPLHRSMKLTAADFETEVTPWEMGLRVDIHDIVRDALVQQHAASFPVRLWHRAFGEQRAVKLKPVVDETVFHGYLKETFTRVDQEPVDARLEIVEGKVKLRVIPHQLGREVDAQAAERRVFGAMMAGASAVELPVKVKQPVLRTESFDTAIIISTSANILKLYGKGELRKTYKVATGTGGYPTPHGQWRITAKRMNPTWYNPNADWSANMPAFIPAGPNNPLGTRALNLNASGIRIHGTPDDASIGSNASHGCIRMHMAEVEQLFEKVNVGTPVLIVS